MRKIDGGETGKQGVEKVMTEIVVTIIVASWPTEHQPTAMPTPCANNGKLVVDSQLHEGWPTATQKILPIDDIYK